MYIPILKWRQGEYLALDRLESAVKDQVAPLVEIPPIEWDFEKGRLAKTIDQHLDPLPKRLVKKWPDRPLFIDMVYLDQGYVMNDDRDPLTYVFDAIRGTSVNAVPVTSLNRTPEYQAAVSGIVETDEVGVCIRLSFEDLARSDAGIRFKALVDYLGASIETVDVVVDLEAPSFQPIDVFVMALRAAIGKITYINNARSFVLAASSFPRTMGDLKKGAQSLDRSEWELYRRYCENLGSDARVPRFGDYGIAHPELPAMDMRLLKPSASLRYTADKTWLIVKGDNVRDYGFGQYVNICKGVVASSEFAGSGYSRGDRYIYECSKGQESTGHLTTWRWVGTNHHITKVVDDLSSLAVP